jgi:hypothetical protein
MYNVEQSSAMLEDSYMPIVEVWNVLAKLSNQDTGTLGRTSESLVCRSGKY